MACQATKNFAAKCEDYFRRADTGGEKGSLSIQEFTRLIRDLLGDTDLADCAIAEIFVDMDDDQDKEMSWEEFKEVFELKDPKAVQEHELREAFKKFDADGSGALTKEELCAAFTAAGVRGDPEKNLDHADTNDDGKVNCDEFISYWKDSI